MRTRSVLTMSVLVLAAALALTAFACDRDETASTSTSATGTTAPAGDALPEDLVLTVAPAEARGVVEVRKSAKDGDRVVMRGVVGGREEPIAENRALFTVLDPAVTTCDTMPGDTCDTPWDACCEPSDVIASKSATVQVAGEDGRPLKTGLAGVGGLAPLKRVVVVGTFRPSPDGQAATVHADGIFVEQ